MTGVEALAYCPTCQRSVRRSEKHHWFNPKSAGKGIISSYMCCDACANAMGLVTMGEFDAMHRRAQMREAPKDE